MQPRTHEQFNNEFSAKMRYFDSGANLTQDSFKGIYNNYVKYHENDLKEVLDRSHNAGVDKMIIKGRTYE